MMNSNKIDYTIYVPDKHTETIELVPQQGKGVFDNLLNVRERILSAKMYLIVLMCLLTMQFSAQSVGGVTSGSASYCAGNNSGFITLTGYTGTILHWEASMDNGATWTVIAQSTPTLSYLNLTQITDYRVIVQDGLFPQDTSTISTITIISSATGTDTRTECNFHTWIDGNTYTANNSTATHNIVGGAVNGCDSVITLDLTINTVNNSNYSFIDNSNGNYSFTNNSTGNFNQSHWAFGDGYTSTIANPNHTFSANGTFIIVLTINDSTFGGPCFDYFIDTIIVTGVTNPLQCNAGFVIYPDTATNGITIINSSIGTNLTYLWGFGDGNTSTLQNPSHTYLSSGPFYLCLTVDDGVGCNSMYCDSIGSNSIIFKQAGFTINVITPPIVTAIDNETKLNSEIKIYPNPTSHKLTVVTDQKTISEINIISVTGKVVKSIRQNTNTINVDDLLSGTYFLKVITDKGIIIKRFTKQ